MFTKTRTQFAALALIAVSPALLAHSGHGVAESTVTSLSHFIGGLDHLLFFLALGLFASRRSFSVLLKGSAIAVGILFAGVHLATSVASMLTAVAASGLIIAGGFVIGRVFDALSERARRA